MTNSERQPLVSCIVAAYNAERYLGEALDSIFAQTYGAFETIVVDDASTDGTRAVAARYGERVKVVVAKTNAGCAASRNLGISNSNGELVAFLDADDYWHPEKIEAQVGALTRDPSAGAAITLLEHFWMPNMTFEENDPSFARFKKPMLGYQLSCVMARRDTFDRVGGFDSQLSEETDWFLRLRHAQIPVAVVDRVLTFRRFHDANISRPKGQRNDDPLLMTLKNEIDRRRKSAIDRNRNTDE